MPKSTRASKNSKTPRNSKQQPKERGGWLAVALATALAIVVCCAAAWVFHRQGHLLYLGDAEAHLNIARRIVDSRTPGYEQTGTAWLPAPHWVMLPFVRNHDWWRSGLAGTIPAVCASALAAVFLFLSARRALACTTAAFIVLFLYLANPNVLYTHSAPMTEPYAALAFAALLYFTIAGRPAAAGVAACFGTLCRYECWFLLPFVAAYFLTKGRRQAIWFSVIAALGPLYWLGHNWYHFSDPLDFYRGYWSPMAIHQRNVSKGMAAYPGDHDYPRALLQFRAAAQLVAGRPLYWMGSFGLLALVGKRAFWTSILVVLPCIFYVQSIHSSGTPIFVPHLWPFSYYNARYGLAAFPMLALGAGALVAIAPRAIRPLVAVVVMAAAVFPWIQTPNKENWITWREADVNHAARRAWTREAAAYLRANYNGGGILAPFGDLTGIFRTAGIPLRETLHEGNGPDWMAQAYAPERFLREQWVVAIAGDSASSAVLKAQRRGPKYYLVKSIVVKGAPVIEIYRRGSQVRLPQKERAPEEADEEPAIEKQLQ